MSSETQPQLPHQLMTCTRAAQRTGNCARRDISIKSLRKYFAAMLLLKLDQPDPCISINTSVRSGCPQQQCPSYLLCLSRSYCQEARSEPSMQREDLSSAFKNHPYPSQATCEYALWRRRLLPWSEKASQTSAESRQPPLANHNRSLQLHLSMRQAIQPAPCKSRWPLASALRGIKCDNAQRVGGSPCEHSLMSASIIYGFTCEEWQSTHQ
jgi:hypothetical protein